MDGKEDEDCPEKIAGNRSWGGSSEA